MIYVDSGPPMYLVGAAHPQRTSIEAFLLARANENYVTSVAVLQEIMSRFAALGRLDAADDAFALLDGLVSSVFPISRTEIDRARKFAKWRNAPPPRVCLHLAVMDTHDVNQVLTTDEHFRLHPGVDCLP